jgi:hypothetical protein
MFGLFATAQRVIGSNGPELIVVRLPFLLDTSFTLTFVLPHLLFGLGKFDLFQSLLAFIFFSLPHSLCLSAAQFVCAQIA